MPINKLYPRFNTCLSGAFAVFFSITVQANSLNNSIQIEKETVKSSVNSQQKIDRFAEATADMNADYKNTLRIIEQLQNYNTQLELVMVMEIIRIVKRNGINSKSNGHN